VHSREQQQQQKGSPVAVVSRTTAQVMWMERGCMSGEEEME
jgi:hypothetical protein